MPKQDSDKPTSAKLKRRKPVQCSAMVRTHRGFWMETPDGHDVHILGDRKMPVATRKALGAMMDAAYKTAARGELKLRQTQFVITPDTKHESSAKDKLNDHPA